MIRLTSDSSTSSAGPARPRLKDVDSFVLVLYPVGVGMPVEGDEKMMHPVDSGTDISHLMDDIDDTCRARARIALFGYSL